MRGKNLTRPEIILTAASKLSDEFTESELVVAAWEFDRKVFGLEGFENEHPAENKVLANLMGVKGLVQKGLLKRTGRKKYRITNNGRSLVRDYSVESGPVTAPVTKQSAPNKVIPTLPKSLDAFIIRVIDSDVYNKFEGSRKDDITFTDYLIAAQVLKKDQGNCQIVIDKLRSIEGKLAELTKIDEEVILSNGRAYNGNDSRVIINLFDWLATRFQKHLLLIAARKKDGVGE